jgi:hypothetical protein
MRHMVFSTFLFPGARHFVELAHPHRSFRSARISAVSAFLYDEEGRERAAASLTLERTVVDLGALFPGAPAGGLVLTEVAYDLPGKRHPYQYGFLYQERAAATPIHYPLDVSLGLTNAVTYWPNHGYFPLGPTPPWLEVRLYLGNVCERAAIEPEVRLVTRRGVESRRVAIPPLRPLTLSLPAGEEPIEYVIVEGVAKPVCYVAGVDRRTGALTFLEHLMQTYKPAMDEGRVGGVPPPAAAPVGPRR